MAEDFTEPFAIVDVNDKLEKLNKYEVDPALLDRTMEFGEALGALSRHPGIVTSARIDETDYMMQGFKEYLEANHENLI